MASGRYNNIDVTVCLNFVQIVDNGSLEDIYVTVRGAWVACKFYTMTCLKTLFGLPVEPKLAFPNDLLETIVVYPCGMLLYKKK